MLTEQHLVEDFDVLELELFDHGAPLFDKLGHDQEVGSVRLHGLKSGSLFVEVEVGEHFLLEFDLDLLVGDFFVGFLQSNKKIDRI